MQVTVTFRRIEPTPALRRHAEDKVRRACKVLRRPIEAHLVLSVLKRRHVAEVTVTANQLVLNATAETHDLYAAIDDAVGKLERQIVKHLKKHQARKHGGAAAVPAAAGRGAERRAVAAERVAIKPMSVGEAIMQLEATRRECLLFHHAASDTVAVLYRRRNGGYGLIEPEVV
jgi:putative sigma-54 modulation protein